MAHELVGKQMRRWEMDNRLKRRFEADETQSALSTPVVTISRQWGSGGTNIAKLVAKKLDFKLYDKEIIEHIAELAGVSPSQIEHHDESELGVFSDLVLQLLEGKRPTSAGYLRALVKAVKQIGRIGDAVIVGRAANLIIPLAFNVRIIAPENVRVQRISELHNTDERTARRMVTHSDRQRYRFVRSQFGADWNDPLAFDMVLNTEHFSIEHAADLIIKGFNDRRQGRVGTCAPSKSSSATHD